jgi:hypothetical protein
MSRLILLGVALVTLLLGGCVSGPGVRGSGNVTTQTRNVSGFNAVSLSGVGTLTIEVTGAESLTVEAEDNIIGHLTTEVRGNHLYIGTENNVSFDPTKPINYRLTVKDLKQIESTGAGNVVATGIKSGDLALEASGAGNIDALAIDATKLTVRISGASDMTAAGAADSQDIRISGSGSYKGENLASKDAQVETSGSGSAVVKVSGTLNAKVSGAGGVQYIGDPQVTQDISGAGSVKKHN